MIEQLRREVNKREWWKFFPFLLLGERLRTFPSQLLLPFLFSSNCKDKKEIIFHLLRFLPHHLWTLEFIKIIICGATQCIWNEVSGSSELYILILVSGISKAHSQFLYCLLGKMIFPWPICHINETKNEKKNKDKWLSGISKFPLNYFRNHTECSSTKQSFITEQFKILIDWFLPSFYF